MEEYGHLGICRDAVVWLGGKTPREAWKECPNPQWLLWWAGKMAGEKGWIGVGDYIRACREYNDLVNQGEKREMGEKYIQHYIKCIRYNQRRRTPKILDESKRAYELLERIREELKPIF